MAPTLIFNMLILFLTIPFYNIAQTYDEPPKLLEDYLEEDLITYCWDINKYTKEEEDYPDEWNKQSAVYLHYSQEYEARVFYYYKHSIETYVPKIHISHLGHHRVKILDKAALKDFSEIYYKNGAHGAYAFTKESRTKDFLNIKIIKPNGTEIIIDKKDFITIDSSKRKVAVPNLEVGDIIDYSLYTHDFLQPCLYAIIDQFSLNHQYPIRNFKYSIITDKHWDVQYTSGEEMLAITSKKIEDDRYKFSIEKKNIERFQTNRWNYHFRSGPYIRMYATVSKDNLLKRSNEGKQLHTSKLTSDNITTHYKKHYNKAKRAASEYSRFKAFLKQKNGKNELTQKKILEEFYYYIRHSFISRHFVSKCYSSNDSSSYERLPDIVFSGHIIYALKKLDIPYDILVVVPRSSGRLEDVVTTYETDYLIRVKLADEYIYFYNPNPYTSFNQFPAQIENVKGYIIDAKDKRGKKLSVDIARLPVSKCTDNVSKYKTTVQFNKKNPTLLKTFTKSTHTGHQIKNYQFDVVDWINMIWKENKLYKTTVWGHPNYYKSEEIASFVEAQTQKREKAFEQIAISHFDIGEDDTKLTNFATQTTANTANDSDLQFSFDCELSNLVKKVGPNYILKAGKLVGGQLNLREEEQERTVDIYMDYARGYEYTVNIEIPEGYEVKGLSNFENNIDNETGTLKSSATLSGNILTIEFIKYYKHNFEPAKNWSLMKEFLKPGAEFATKEILLKKKK